MHGLPARRLASTVLCAAVLTGITGPAAVAADSAGERGHATASRSAVPGAEKLLAQVRALEHTGSVLQPVVDLLKASLQNGTLPPDQARLLGEAAKKAIAEAAVAEPKPNTPATPTTPAKPATPTTPAKPAAPATPSLPPKPAASSAPALPATPAVPAAAKQGDDGNPPSARDLTDDALSSLETAVDNLLKAVTGDLDQLISSATDVVGGLVNLLTTTLLGDGLPAPSLTALPSLPSVSTTG
ncbi:hypothetical protein [Streptomyces sp. NPDC048191]|uniref:hypothetical protein n=1 Tax=Streptomyces sp. NPDC048191 TaxID=3155484 RepID=UPI0033FE8B1B